MKIDNKPYEYMITHKLCYKNIFLFFLFLKEIV